MSLRDHASSVDREALDHELKGMVKLFLSKSAIEIRMTLVKRLELRRHHRQLGRRSFIKLIEEIDSTVGPERLERELSKIQETEEKE